MTRLAVNAAGVLALATVAPLVLLWSAARLYVTARPQARTVRTQGGSRPSRD